MVDELALPRSTGARRRRTARCPARCARPSCPATPCDPARAPRRSASAGASRPRGARRPPAAAGGASRRLERPPARAPPSPRAHGQGVHDVLGVGLHAAGEHVHERRGGLRVRVDRGVRLGQQRHDRGALGLEPVRRRRRARSRRPRRARGAGRPPPACSSASTAGSTPRSSASTWRPANDAGSVWGGGVVVVNAHLPPGSVHVRGQGRQAVEAHRGVARRVGAGAEELDDVAGREVEGQADVGCAVEDVVAVAGGAGEHHGAGRAGRGRARGAGRRSSRPRSRRAPGSGRRRGRPTAGGAPGDETTTSRAQHPGVGDQRPAGLGHQTGTPPARRGGRGPSRIAAAQAARSASGRRRAWWGSPPPRSSSGGACPPRRAATRAATSIAARPGARGSRCWLPTWNPMPAASRPAARARPSSATASSSLTPNLPANGVAAPSSPTASRTPTVAPGASRASRSTSAGASVVNRSTPAARAARTSVTFFTGLPQDSVPGRAPASRQRSSSPTLARSNEAPSATSRAQDLGLRVGLDRVAELHVGQQAAHRAIGVAHGGQVQIEPGVGISTVGGRATSRAPRAPAPTPSIVPAEKPGEPRNG